MRLGQEDMADGACPGNSLFPSLRVWSGARGFAGNAIPRGTYHTSSPGPQRHSGLLGTPARRPIANTQPRGKTRARRALPSPSPGTTARPSTRLRWHGSVPGLYARRAPSAPRVLRPPGTGSTEECSVTWLPDPGSPLSAEGSSSAMPVSPAALLLGREEPGRHGRDREGEEPRTWSAGGRGRVVCCTPRRGPPSRWLGQTGVVACGHARRQTTACGILPTGFRALVPTRAFPTDYESPRRRGIPKGRNVVPRICNPVLLDERIPDYTGERYAPQTPDLEKADGGRPAVCNHAPASPGKKGNRCPHLASRSHVGPRSLVLGGAWCAGARCRGWRA